MKTMIPFGDADFTSVEGAFRVVRAAFDSIVDDPSDTTIIASSLGNIAVVSGCTGASIDDVKTRVAALQAAAGERCVLAAGWLDPTSPGTIDIWLGTMPTTTHRYAY